MSVSIKYKGNEIASMTATGTKTLKTGGKYCEGNISVENTEKSLQTEKSVSVTANGTVEVTPDEGYDGVKKVSVAVNVPTGGGTTVISPKDINFYDYDGTCVAAWSLAELAGKTALPDYPAHEGLTCQGWNWTLADLKTENAKMNVGAMYITTDGKTRLHIVLPEQRKTLRLGLCVNGTAVIDWGDGSETASLQGTNLNTVLYTAAHSYSASGAYTISIAVTGSARIPANQYVFTGAVSESGGTAAVLRSILTGVHFGSNMSCSQNSFTNFANLEYITVPSTSVGIQNMSAIQSCAKLRQITYAPGITEIGYSNAQGTSIAVVCLNNGVEGLAENSFSNASNMSVTFPKSVVRTWSHFIRANNTIKEITIPGLNGATGMNACYSCKALERITVGSGVTKILSNFASECPSLLTVVCLGSLESIAGGAFTNANAAVSFDFTACTAVPTLENANAFSGIPADCEIRVPAALLDEWKAATNWATYANQIVGV